MTDDEIHRIAGILGDVVEKRLADVPTKADLERFATKADLAAIRAEMATKADLEQFASNIHARFDRFEVKVNERFDDLDLRVSHLESR